MPEEPRDRERRRISRQILVLGFAFLALVPLLMLIRRPQNLENDLGMMWAVVMSSLFGLVLLMVGVRLRP